MSAVEEGEVAIISFHLGEHVLGSNAEVHLAVRADKGFWNVCTPDVGVVHDDDVKSVRRVIVVDPLGSDADRLPKYVTSVQLLRTALDQKLEGNVPYNPVEDAVRLLTPSIPDEPHGLAAVATDIDNTTWVRTKAGTSAAKWVTAMAPSAAGKTWDELVVDVVDFIGAGVIQ